MAVADVETNPSQVLRTPDARHSAGWSLRALGAAQGSWLYGLLAYLAELASTRVRASQRLRSSGQHFGQESRGAVTSERASEGTDQ
jgi:hypothetical protein